MKINYNKPHLSKTVLLLFACIISLLIIFLPLQLNAHAASSEVLTNVGTVEYNGSTYYARYNIQLTSTSGEVGTNPYEFKNLYKMALVEKAVSNAWLTNFHVENLKTTLTKPDGSTQVTNFENYNFYKTAPTKIFYNGSVLPAGQYTLRVQCKISRGNYSSNPDVTVIFNVVA